MPKRRKKETASVAWMLHPASFSTSVFAFSSKLADSSAAFCTSHHCGLMMAVSGLSRTEALLSTQTVTSEAATDSLNCAKSCSAGSRMLVKRVFPELLGVLNCKLGGCILLAVATVTRNRRCGQVASALFSAVLADSKKPAY